MKENYLAGELAQFTEIMFQNIQITLDELTDVRSTPAFSDMPLWKHVYHMLHSLDQWFINPDEYQEPGFHRENMNSLFVLSEKGLTKEELQKYFEDIKLKLRGYLKELSDGELGDKPDQCDFTKLRLMLGQYRHLSYHMGMIHSFIRSETGNWPAFKGLLQTGRQQGTFGI